ncbi:peptidylprolyl isomerase [Altericroceibacterium xinjiangense]|uniref:peptidylprolyl isomerase n=1 Tax=Altericroceibacterium xinjiangense TaxID=762261 RepID=UPI000F7F3FAC|nr:SurA N-terminal domain-containing protein [Altericroceibacterium xinjiangense]
MLQLFRSFFNSKLGVVFTLGFLVLIALAFASADVAGGSMFGGVAGGDRVAVVGDETITTGDLSMNVRSRFDSLREQNPTLTMEAFIAQGGVEDVLNQMVQRAAIAQFGKEYGLRAGDRLVDSEIVKIPAFRGPDGTFDENLFRSALRQRGLTEAVVRSDISSGLVAQQLITPVVEGAKYPDAAARRYAALLKERRQGAIAALPSAAFAPQGAPTDQQLQAYYAVSRDNYIRPERRVIRYATFGIDSLGGRAAPSEAQIAERFQRDQAQYGAREARSFTQLVVPSQDVAQQIVTQVRSGTSLPAAASARGLATAEIGPVTQNELANQSSAAAAQAAFAADQGAIVQPLRGGLGWYVLKVNAIDRTPARTLDQVRGEITQALTEEQRRAALADLGARIEEEIDEGRTLSEVAQELGAEVQTTRPLTAEGRVYGDPEATAPEVLQPAVATAFQMEEGQPQVAEVVPGQTYLVYDVAQVTPSAAAPLGEIRDDVVQAWRRDQGFEAAGQAARRVMERVAKGASLAEAIRAEKVSLPAPDSISMSREELAQAGQVPPALALFFSMAEGTVKRLAAPGRNGWLVAELEDIEVGALSADDPLIASTRQQLGSAAADEYSQQFVTAAQRHVGIERNEDAIAAVKAELAGSIGG